MKCPSCNSDNVMDGKLQGYHGVSFVEKGTENKWRPHAYPIEGKACRDCGVVFDLRIVSAGRRKIGKDTE